MNKITSLIVLLGLATSSLAHTYLHDVLVNGRVDKKCVRPHRSWALDDPINLITDADMLCGHGREAMSPAREKCPVAAGSPMSLQWWHTQPGDDVIAYTHKGPCMVYLARSDTGAGAVWFKIFESGLDIATQTWCVDKLIQDRGRLDFTLPADLAPGNYLLRGEIIALHNGYAVDGAQPYVHCAELTITGSGTKVVTENLVAFPGAYNNRDPGLYPVSLYNGPLSRYVIPGPPVYKATANPGTNPTPTTGNNNNPTTGTPSTGNNNTPTTGTPSTGNNNNPSTGTPSTGTPSTGSTGLPTVSSAETCANVEITTAVRNVATWGNPARTIIDISVRNKGSKQISDLVVAINPTGASQGIDEGWNMVKLGSSNNYYFSEKINPGQTYKGAGFIVAGSTFSIQAVCASSTGNNNNPSTGTSASTTGSPSTPASTTGSPSTPATTTTTTGSPSTPATTTGTPSTGTPATSGNSGNNACRAGIAFTTANAWNGGGMVNVVVSNTGSQPIKAITITINVENGQSWNVVSTSTPKQYTLPSWALPIAPGARFSDAGYTYNGNAPAAGTVVSVSC